MAEFIQKRLFLILAALAIFGCSDGQGPSTPANKAPNQVKASAIATHSYFDTVNTFYRFDLFFNTPSEPAISRLLSVTMVNPSGQTISLKEGASADFSFSTLTEDTIRQCLTNHPAMKTDALQFQSAPFNYKWMAFFLDFNLVGNYEFTFVFEMNDGSHSTTKIQQKISSQATYN